MVSFIKNLFIVVQDAVNSKANTPMKGGCRSRIEIFLCSQHHLLNYKATESVRKMPESLIQSSAGELKHPVLLRGW